MRDTWIVFRKELLDTLRDRRTLFMVLVLPTLLFPVLLYAVATFSASQAEEAQTKTLKIGLARAGNAAAFADQLRAHKNLRVVEGFSADSARSLVRRDSLDAIFRFADHFDQAVTHRTPGAVSLFYKTGSDAGIVQDRLRRLVDAYRRQLKKQRLADLNLDEHVLQTVRLREVDVATKRETLGQTVGGFIPYVFLLFCFMGGMYPAIDLGAGEKERHTMETLLTAPASRLSVAIGKFGMVVVGGLVSAGISIVGLYAGIKLTNDLPSGIETAVASMFTPSAIGLLLALLVPLTMFFAGIQLVLSLYAKSFKEAQSIFSPLMIGIILPAAAGLIPGVELTVGTALVPILNVALATKDILSGTIDAGLLALVFGSLLLLAAASLGACTYFFEREDVIFRT